MKIAACVVVVLVGCGSKNNCEPRKKDAAAAVNSAIKPVAYARDKAKTNYDEIKKSHDLVHAGQDELAERLKLFEQSMDCLVTKDCCKRLASKDPSVRTSV